VFGDWDLVAGTYVIGARVTRRLEKSDRREGGALDANAVIGSILRHQVAEQRCESNRIEKPDGNSIGPRKRSSRTSITSRGTSEP
jgi:hypothetical protein